MFRELPRYASTRRTTLPWAVDIPSHWQVGRAKSIMRALDVRSDAGEEELLTVSSSRGVVPRASAQVNMFKAESYAGHKLCWPGDLVINSLWAWGRGLGVAQHHGIVSTAYGVYRQHGDALNADYLHQLVRSEPFQWELQVRSQGVWKSRLQITDDRWLDAPLLVPAHEEQAAIVKYLAHANARIDKAITAKRRLSSLLEEQRRAVAHEHLTHGGWPSWPLGKIGRIGNGSTPSRSVQSYWGGTTPWLNSSVVNQESVSQSNQFVTDEALANCHLPLVPAESVLVGITGQGRTRGMSTVLRIEATVNQHIAFITPNEKLASADYVNLALTVGYGELRQISEGVGGTKGALTLTDLKSFKVPLPSLSQQEQVLADVRRLSIELRNALTRVQREISLLEEFRTRLVADVVTGQVDVRAIAASLPDTPEQHTDLGSLLDDDIEDVLGQGEE